MSYYFDYIEGLCHESTESWAIVQICEELDRRDDEIAAEKRNTEVERISGSAVLKELLELKKEIQEYQNAMVFYFGRSKCFEAVEQFRAECC